MTTQTKEDKQMARYTDLQIYTTSEKLEKTESLEGLTKKYV